MRAVVVYESMYGNTRVVAEAIGQGLGPSHDVVVVPVSRARPGVLDGAGLLVVGGPTHVHGMSRPRSREAAVEVAAKPESTVVIEDGATGPGVREWLASLGHLHVAAAAFDTRASGPPALTGRASKGISHELVKHGAYLVARPESFLVTKQPALAAGEEARARQWAAGLVAGMQDTTERSTF